MRGDWDGTHLAVEASHIRVRDDLGDDRADAEHAKHGVAVAVEVERVADRDGERGPLLGRGHREELAHLERGLAFRAGAREEGVVGERENLLDRVRKEKAVRGPVGERVWVLGVVLPRTSGERRSGM